MERAQAWSNADLAEQEGLARDPLPARKRSYKNPNVEKEVTHHKMIFVGDTQVGKTSIFMR